jgi:DNA repair exonuclease SbcCD ATPase subunit
MSSPTLALSTGTARQSPRKGGGGSPVPGTIVGQRRLPASPTTAGGRPKPTPMVWRGDSGSPGGGSLHSPGQAQFPSSPLGKAQRAMAASPTTRAGARTSPYPNSPSYQSAQDQIRSLRVQLEAVTAEGAAARQAAAEEAQVAAQVAAEGARAEAQAVIAAAREEAQAVIAEAEQAAAVLRKELHETSSVLLELQGRAEEERAARAADSAAERAAGEAQLLKALEELRREKEHALEGLQQSHEAALQSRDRQQAAAQEEQAAAQEERLAKAVSTAAELGPKLERARAAEEQLEAEAKVMAEDPRTLEAALEDIAGGGITQP